RRAKRIACPPAQQRAGGCAGAASATAAKHQVAARGRGTEVPSPRRKVLPFSSWSTRATILRLPPACDFVDNRTPRPAAGRLLAAARGTCPRLRRQSDVTSRSGALPMDPAIPMKQLVLCILLMASATAQQTQPPVAAIPKPAVPKPIVFSAQ